MTLPQFGRGSSWRSSCTGDRCDTIWMLTSLAVFCVFCYIQDAAVGAVWFGLLCSMTVSLVMFVPFEIAANPCIIPLSMSASAITVSWVVGCLSTWHDTLPARHDLAYTGVYLASYTCVMFASRFSEIPIEEGSFVWYLQLYGAWLAVFEVYTLAIIILTIFWVGAYKLWEPCCGCRIASYSVAAYALTAVVARILWAVKKAEAHDWVEMQVVVPTVLMLMGALRLLLLGLRAIPEALRHRREMEAGRLEQDILARLQRQRDLERQHAGKLMLFTATAESVPVWLGLSSRTTIKCIAFSGETACELQPERGADIGWLRGKLAAHLDMPNSSIQLVSAAAQVLEDAASVEVLWD